MKPDDSIEAYKRALMVLTSSPEGRQLAGGQPVRIASSLCPGIAYQISANANARIDVYRYGTFMGDLCIVPRNGTPLPDVQYTKLQLCKYGERDLWETSIPSADMKWFSNGVPDDTVPGWIFMVVLGLGLALIIYMLIAGAGK